MTQKLLAQGAEASIYQKNNEIIKERLVKSYRFSVLDTRLRKSRTKKEIKLLEKASKIINVPKVIASSDFSITLEQIKGKKLASDLDKLTNKIEIAKKIGESVAKLHNAGIIHGDLTTSNMILVENGTPHMSMKMESFNKKLIELKKLNLPSKEYAVFGSGPLAIRGIRESNDLDIVAKPKLWNKLIKKYPLQKEWLINIGPIEVYKDWSLWFKNTNKLIDDAETFEEVPFVKLKYVIAWKKAYNREKDRKDIELIEQYQLSNKIKLYLIDFGLGFESDNIEDKAVDLHVLKEALTARHNKHSQSLFKTVVESYKIAKDSSLILNRLETVEKRGRYKQAY